MGVCCLYHCRELLLLLFVGEAGAVLARVLRGELSFYYFGLLAIKSKPTIYVPAGSLQHLLSTPRLEGGGDNGYAQYRRRRAPESYQAYPEI